MDQAEEASTALLDETDKEPSMQSIQASPIPLPDGWIASPAIDKLPLELVSYIAKLSLPEFYSSPERMPALYSIRMISRMWRDAIDSTPALWNVVSSDVPLQVNATAIQRSGNSPLDVYIPQPTLESLFRAQTSPLSELLELAAGEIGRWSMVDLWLPSRDVCSRYLSSPAPRLRNLRVETEHEDEPTTPLALFGGIAPKLEKLAVEQLPIDWTSLPTQGLRTLSISYMQSGQISTQQVLDILASTPLLKELKIYCSNLDHHLRPSMQTAVIQLPGLTTIYFAETNVEMTEIILSSIRAPSCTSLNIQHLEGDPTDFSNFLERALSHFNDFQRLTLSSNKNSTITFWDEAMEWECRTPGSDGLEFEVTIPPSAAAVGWATRVIGQGDEGLVHNLELVLNQQRLNDESLAAYYSLSRCQSVTEILVDNYHKPTRPILDLIGTWGESEDGIGPLPAFPGLRKLVFRSRHGWTLDDLEASVNCRFGGREDILNGKVPKLCIDIRGWYSDDVLAPKLDLAQLQRLRAATGVEGVTHEVC